MSWKAENSNNNNNHGLTMNLTSMEHVMLRNC